MGIDWSDSKKTHIIKNVQCILPLRDGDALGRATSIAKKYFDEILLLKLFMKKLFMGCYGNKVISYDNHNSTINIL